jgi:hypothetical protein
MIRASVLVLGLIISSAAYAKDIAVCGASEGYSYFPEAGLLAAPESEDAGKWKTDAISSGRLTLSRSGDRFDLLFTDATGAVISARGDGGEVVRVGQTADAITVVVNYSGSLVETYTFIKAAGGAEAIWSTNKYGTLIPKIGAYRAPCSLLVLE